MDKSPSGMATNAVLRVPAPLREEKRQKQFRAVAQGRREKMEKHFRLGHPYPKSTKSLRARSSTQNAVLRVPAPLREKKTDR
jgi:hypothetical protein